MPSVLLARDSRRWIPIYDRPDVIVYVECRYYWTTCSTLGKYNWYDGTYNQIIVTLFNPLYVWLKSFLFKFFHIHVFIPNAPAYPWTQNHNTVRRNRPFCVCAYPLIMRRKQKCKMVLYHYRNRQTSSWFCKNSLNETLWILKKTSWKSDAFYQKY